MFSNARHAGRATELEVDIDSGVVKNFTTGKSLKAEALPPNIQHILKQGGLVVVTERSWPRAPCRDAVAHYRVSTRNMKSP